MMKREDLPKGRTDWGRVRNMTDEEIGYDPENPPWTAEDFASATLVLPSYNLPPLRTRPMNLPDWATHVAVNEDGEIWVYDEDPMWDDGYWICRHDSGRAQRLEIIPADFARMLCVAIPRPEREEKEP